MCIRDNDKSLHLLLQAFSDRGWIKPKHKVKKQKEKHIIEWSISVENFYKKFNYKLIELITSEPPVSYTHLDVYKRQMT